MEKSFERKASFEVQTVERQKARRQKSAWGWVSSSAPSLQGPSPCAPLLPAGPAGCAIGMGLAPQLVYTWLEGSCLSERSKEELPRARAHLALCNQVQQVQRRCHASQDAPGWGPPPKSQENQTAWATMSVASETCSNWHPSLPASASQHSPQERKVGPWGGTQQQLPDARDPVDVSPHTWLACSSHKQIVW